MLVVVKVVVTDCKQEVSRGYPALSVTFSNIRRRKKAANIIIQTLPLLVALVLLDFGGFYR